MPVFKVPAPNFSESNSIDRYVGSHIRQRRRLLGITQQQLAKAIGVTFQMVQKYEKGSCRVGASRLLMIANMLDVPVAHFFEKYRGNIIGAKVKIAEGCVEMDEHVMSQKETIDLLKAYYSLPEEARKGILSMMNGLKVKKPDS